LPIHCFDMPEEIKAADEAVRSYIAESMARLLSESNIDEAIYAVLPGGEQADENVEEMKGRMTVCVLLKSD